MIKKFITETALGKEGRYVGAMYNHRRREVNKSNWGTPVNRFV